MTVQVAVTDTAPTAYRVYRTTTGRDREYVGPPWATPREAARYADLIDQPYTSPLRASGNGAPVTPDSSPESVVAPSPEPRTDRVSGSGSTRVPAPPPVSVELLPEARQRGSTPTVAG